MKSVQWNLMFWKLCLVWKSVEMRAGRLSLVPEGDLGVTFESLGTDTGRELQVSFCFYFSRE